MTEAAWRERIGVIANELRVPPQDDSAAQHRFERALSLLWSAMQSPPASVRAAYEALQETAIAAIATPRADDLNRAAYPDWVPELDRDLPSVVLAVAAEVRALDKALFECRDPLRATDPNIDYLAYGDEPVFILPRIRNSLPDGRTGQQFERRGLIYHRVLPTHTDGLAIKLFSPALQGPGMDGTAADLVSAMFPIVHPKITYDTPATKFRIDRLLNEEELVAHVKAQMVGLFSGAPAMAIVWPELTISPALLRIILAALNDRALSDDPVGLGFVVAGSWHEVRGKRCLNVAEVLDQFGSSILKYCKRERYQAVPGVLEDIEPGDALPVLLYGDVLVAFGLCKDFCERRYQTPYPSLDVDLVVVPSFGTPRTMDEHTIAAGSLNVIYGARSFVVQQHIPDADGQEVWGSVLRPPERPRGAAEPPTPQNILLERSRISCTLS